MIAIMQAYEKQLKKYLAVEQAVASIEPAQSVGTLWVETAPLKASLKAEVASWKAQFAKKLHRKGQDDLLVGTIAAASCGAH